MSCNTKLNINILNNNIIVLHPATCYRIRVCNHVYYIILYNHVFSIKNIEMWIARAGVEHGFNEKQKDANVEYPLDTGSACLLSEIRRITVFRSLIIYRHKIGAMQANNFTS